MHTNNWEIENLFDNPIKAENIRFKDIPLEIPSEIESLVRRDWEVQLNTKMKSLSSEKPNLSIKPYAESQSPNSLPALYEGDKPIMWPGPTISLNGVRNIKSEYFLDVSQTSFPLINLSSKGEIKEAFEAHKINPPRPALAICTFALTTDNQLALTLRGPKTNMYPGRLYGQGGNPLYTKTSTLVHQTEEMEDEILVKEKDIISGSLYFGGIVNDTHMLMNKPDLVGWVSLNISSEEIKKRVESRPFEKRPGDSVGVVFAPSDEKGLRDFLTMRTHPLQYCPPAHAGLFVYGYHTFGKEWYDRTLKETPN